MKKEVVLITGANGMVARQLVKQLNNNYTIRFLTRKKRKKGEYEWDIKRQYLDLNALIGVDHIIHLAGAGIADKRWSKERKRTLISSRIDTAKLILTTLQTHDIKITSFISASAIGYYGTETTKKIHDEDSNKGDDFLSNICHEWEKIANKFTSEKIAERTVIVRIGIVLSKDGGALKKMIIPCKYYIGSVLGKGNQYMPWVHINDLCSLFEHLVVKKYLKGVFNAVSPTHTDNEEFTKTLAKVLNKPLLLPNMPSFFIKGVFGESSLLLLNGSRVSSKKVIKTDFIFKYSNLKTALLNLLNSE